MKFFGQTEAFIASRNAGFLRASGQVYAVCGRTSEALAAYREAETLLKKVLEIEPRRQDGVNSELARLYLDRGDLYAARREGRQEARNQYQKAVDILSPLKKENQIRLDELRDLGRAQAKLQALAG